MAAALRVAFFAGRISLADQLIAASGVSFLVLLADLCGVRAARPVKLFGVFIENVGFSGSLLVG